MDIPLNIDQQLYTLWYNQLKDAEQLADVISICMNICAKSGHALRSTGTITVPCNISHSTSNEIVRPGQHQNNPSHRSLVKNLLLFMLAEDISHTSRKSIAKACFGVCRSLDDYYGELKPRITDLLTTVTAGQSLENKSIVFYGMLHSTFLKRFLTEQLFSDVPEQLHALFESPAAGYTRWFHTISECVLTTLDRPANLPQWNVLTASRLWAVALVNLESPYRGVRENMLRSLKHLVQNRQFASNTVLPTVAGWHWQNRNKYHLLALLFHERRPEEVLNLCAISMSELDDALTQSLRYKHLFSGGQSLLRAIHNDDVQALTVKIIKTGDYELLRNMVKYWFSFFSPKSYSAVFHLLKLDKLAPNEDQLPTFMMGKRYERLFLLTYLFQREFQKHNSSLEELLIMLCQLADREKPLPTASMGLLIKTLAYHTISWRSGSGGKLQMLKKLEQYMLDAIETPGNIGLCNIVVEQCRLLLDKDSTSDHQYVIPRFLYSMYERYLCPYGKRKAPYQETITGLRLFGLLVEQCFEFKSPSRYQLRARPPETVLWLSFLRPITLDPKQQLADLRVDVMELNHLLQSEYEDVRNTVLRILYNQSSPTSYDSVLLIRLTNIHSSETHLYPCLLHRVEHWVRTAVDNLCRDLYACTTVVNGGNPSMQLHQAVERASLVCYGIPELLDGSRSIEAFWSLSRVVGSVVDNVLNLLNAARPSDTPSKTAYSSLTVGTSFEIMERSMQLLLEQSPQWLNEEEVSPIEIALAKRSMQVELWKALRAVAVFTEKYAVWLLDHAEYFPDVADKELSTCLKRFGNILFNCCHRGAIESSAHCLGRVVRRIMHEKAHKSRHLMFKSTKYLAPECHVERLFQEVLAVEPVHLSDFRRSRGYLYLLHAVMRNEADGSMSDSLLRIYLQRHVMLSERASLEENLKNDNMRPIGVFELHQLNMLVRDALLNEAMLPFTDELMIVALQAFRRPEWPVRNAAMQLYTSCTIKLAGQQQQFVDAQCDWPPVYVSLDEVMCKLPCTVRYVLGALQDVLQATESMKPLVNRSCSTGFLLLLLEFLARFEYRAYDDAKLGSIVTTFRSSVWELLGHEHEQVRKQAARCYVQLHVLCLLDKGEQFLGTVEHLLRAMFLDSVGPNFQHGLCLALDAYVRRYVTLRHYTRHASGNSREDTLASIRRLVVHYHNLNSQRTRTSSFRYRTTLHGFLCYIGLDHTDPVMLLMHHHDAPNSLGMEAFTMQFNRTKDVDGIANSLMPYEMVLVLDNEPEQDG